MADEGRRWNGCHVACSVRRGQQCCAGPSPTSSPGLVQLQMGQARPPPGTPSAPHQPWQALMQTGNLASPQGGPRPGTVMYSAPPGGPMYAPQSAGQQPVSIRLSNYAGDASAFLTHVSCPLVTPIQTLFQLPRSKLPCRGPTSAGPGSLHRLGSLSGCNLSGCPWLALPCV